MAKLDVFLAEEKQEKEYWRAMVVLNEMVKAVSAEIASRVKAEVKLPSDVLYFSLKHDEAILRDGTTQQMSSVHSYIDAKAVVSAIMAPDRFDMFAGNIASRRNGMSHKLPFTYATTVAFVELLRNAQKFTQLKGLIGQGKALLKILFVLKNSNDFVTCLPDVFQ